MDDINDIQFSHDSQLMASGHDDGMVKIWDVETGTLIKTWMTSPVYSPYVAFSHDSKRVVATSDKITIYNIENDQSMSLYGFEGHPNAAAVFNHDDTMVASGHMSGNIYLWNTKTGRLDSNYKGHQDRVWSVAFSPDGTKLVSGSADRTIKLWDIFSSDSFVKEFKVNDIIMYVSFNNDGTKILSQDESFEAATIWDVETENNITVNATMDGVKFNYDGTKIVSWSMSYDKNETIMWDVETGNSLYKIDTPEYVHSIGFNSDNMILLVEDNEHNFNIVTWNLQNMTSQKIPLVYDRSSPKTVIKDSINTVIKKPWNTNCDMSEKDLYDMVSHSSKRNGNYTYKSQGAEIKVKIYQSTDKFIRAMLVSYKLDDIIFRDSGEQELLISYDILTEQIEIMLVYIGAGKGICTKAVAYTMRALMDYINRQNKFALYGKVYIESINPCAAFNCYNRAFRMNGFELNDDEEYENYKEELKEDVEWISYTFESFINKKQQLMKTEYRIRRKIKELKEKRKKVNTEINDIKKLGPKLKF